MPRRVPELEYDDIIVRRISQQGSLKMRGERTFISEIFAHEWLGLRALDEGYFQLFYGPVSLGYLGYLPAHFPPRSQPRATP